MQSRPLSHPTLSQTLAHGGRAAQALGQTLGSRPGSAPCWLGDE